MKMVMKERLSTAMPGPKSPIAKASFGTLSLMAESRRAARAAARSSIAAREDPAAAPCRCARRRPGPSRLLTALGQGQECLLEGGHAGELLQLLGGAQRPQHAACA